MERHPSVAETHLSRRANVTLNINKVAGMFNVKSRTGFQGSGYVVLNGVRAVNIFVLAATAAACFLLMIFGKMPNAFQFFTDVNLAALAALCCLLIWTELPFNTGKKWINHTWPVLGPRHGFVWLGVAMLLMGCHTLGALSHTPYSKKDLGGPVWRIIAASGCLGIAFGILNVLASWLYSDRAEGVSARQVRAEGATARAHSRNSASDDGASYPDTDGYSSRSDSVRKEKTRSRRVSLFRHRLPISRPMPQDRDVERGYGGGAAAAPPHAVSDISECPDSSVVDDRSSPIMPPVKRPPTALHPAMNGGVRSSIYSEASHLNRFDDNKF